MRRTAQFFICAGLLAACAIPGTSHAAPDYVPDDGALQRMQTKEARRIVGSLADIKMGCFNCEYKVMSRVRLVDKGDLEFIRSSGGQVRIPLNTLQIEVEKFAFGLETGLRLAQGQWIWFGRNFDDAKQLADALFVLRKHASGYEDPRIEAEFQSAAKAYRENPAKFEFPESARRHRVVAEAAVRDKDLEGAFESYAEALRLVPWWPAGRFNAAHLLAELGRHGEAAREMKRYLVLLPDAPNARESRDKVYEWEAKAERGR